MLPSSDPVIYHLDAQAHIVYVNDSWARFARQAGAEALSESKVIGRSLWSFIKDPAVRHIYKILYDRILSGSRPSIRLNFRCDTPDIRRFMEMELKPLAAGGGRIEVSCRTLREEARSSVEVTNTQASSAQLLTMCSICKGVHDSEGSSWQEIEDVLRQHGPMDGDAPILVSHTVCESCQRTLGLA
jgi:hypothetical protein